MTRAKLHAVPDTPPKVVDLYGPWRAEIASRDWEAVHIRGERAPAIDIAQPAHRRGWRHVTRRVAVGEQS